MMSIQEYTNTYAQFLLGEIVEDPSEYAAGLDLTVPQMNDIYFSSKRVKLGSNFVMAGCLALREVFSPYFRDLLDQLDRPGTFVKLSAPSGTGIDFTPSRWKEALSSDSLVRRLKDDIGPIRDVYKPNLPGLPGAKPWKGRVIIYVHDLVNAIRYFGFDIDLDNIYGYPEMVWQFYQRYLIHVGFIPSIFEDGGDRLFTLYYIGPDGKQVKHLEESLFGVYLILGDSKVPLASAFQFASSEVALAAFEAETDPEKQAEVLKWIFLAERHDLLEAFLASDLGLTFLGLISLVEDPLNIRPNFTPFLRIFVRYYGPELVVDLFCDNSMHDEWLIMSMVDNGDIEAITYLSKLPTFNKESVGIKAALEQAARLRFMDIVELLS